MKSRPVCADTHGMTVANVPNFVGAEGVSDAIFSAVFLGGCVLVAALSLWAAQCMKLGAWATPKRAPGVFRSAPTLPQRRMPRLVLGCVGLGVTLAYMMGFVPGTLPMPEVSAVAASAGAMLALLTVGSALVEQPRVSVPQVDVEHIPDVVGRIGVASGQRQDAA